MRPSIAICSTISLGAAVCASALIAAGHPPAAADAALPRIFGYGSTDPAAPVLPGQLLPAVTPAASTNGTTCTPATAPAGAREHATVRHCSIVGAVQFPGTYATERPSLLLRTLIKEAGGLTADAAGTLRILHDGRCHNVSIASMSDTLLIPLESVVVVDSASAGPRAAVGDASTYTDVACINLCERPVVLFLGTQAASVSQVLAMLGQPAETAASVQVLSPTGWQAVQNDGLTSGSVLVFNPQAVNQVALADALAHRQLQDLVTLPPHDVQQTAAETIELFQFLEDRMQPATDVVSADGDEGFADPSVSGIDPLTAPPVAALPTPDAYPSLPGALADVTTPPEDVEAIKEHDAQVFPASAVQLRSVTRPPALPVDEIDELDPEIAKAMDDAVTEHAAADEAMAPIAADDANGNLLRFGRSFLAWVFGGLVAYGVFLAASSQKFTGWMRRLRSSLATRKPAEQEIGHKQVDVVTPLSTRSTLSQLIDNSLPIREEEAPAPIQALHGRSVGFRYLIRSGPHPIQGPHFAATRMPATPAPVIAAATHPETAKNRDIERSQSSGRTHSRVDSAEEVHSPKRAHSAAASSRGVSPLERALHSLLREGREHAS